MSKALQKRCLLCNKPFVTHDRSRIYCCRDCYKLAKRGNYVRGTSRQPPQPVKIRLPKRLPVFPEFQLTPGIVYNAAKYQSCQSGRTTYIVTLDEKHKTIVREDECEEVPHE